MSEPEVLELLDCDSCRAAWYALDEAELDDDREEREATLVEWHDAGHPDMPVPEPY